MNAALVSAGAHPNGPQRSGGRRQPLRGGAGAASSAYSPGIGFAMCGERSRGLRIATQITAPSQFERVSQTEKDERAGHDRA